MKTRNWLSRDPVEEQGGRNFYAFCYSAGQTCRPFDHGWLVGGGWSAGFYPHVGGPKPDNGRTASSRTSAPTAILAHFSAVITATIQTYCDGPGTVPLHLWKDQNGDCHDELVMICLPQEDTGGGGA